jgi:hypothetical protein
MAGRTQTEQPEQAQDEEVNEVTRPSDLGFPKVEIEVERVRTPMNADPDGFVQIRMARTIDDFTFGNPHVSYLLEAGKYYRMPVTIATYLDSLGCIYHTM